LRPTLILHIGLERTGTTSLQRFCADYKRDLRKASILYPTRSLAYAGGAWRNHAPLASCYFHPHLRDLTIPFPPEQKKMLLASLFREIDSSGADIALLSSEHLSSRLRLPQIRVLAADLAGYDCRVGVVVRDPASRFFSSYSAHIVSGGITSIGAYTDSKVVSESPYFRSAEVIRPWEEAFGPENIGVFAYDRKGDTLRAMLERFAPRELSPPPLSSYSENFSYGPSLIEAFRCANIRATERRSWSNTPEDWARRRAVNFLLRLWLKTTQIDLRAGSWALDDSRMAEVKALAEADRQWLNERYGIRFPEQKPTPARDGEQAKFHMEKFLKRADDFWRLIDAIAPIVAAARFTGRTTRLARNALGF
jgi:hypothetical protein